MRNIIKVLRAQNNLTQEELAQKIGISRQALSNIENNKVQPSGKVVIKIANIFGMPAEQIFFEEDVMHEEYNGMADLKEKFEEKKVLLEAIEERINQLTDDKHLAKLYRIWLTKDLKEFFKVKSYGLISGKDMVAAIEIVRKWEPGVDISKITTQTSREGVFV